MNIQCLTPCSSSPARIGTNPGGSGAGRQRSPTMRLRKGAQRRYRLSLHRRVRDWIERDSIEITIMTKNCFTLVALCVTLAGSSAVSLADEFVPPRQKVPLRDEGRIAFLRIQLAEAESAARQARIASEKSHDEAAQLFARSKGLAEIGVALGGSTAIDLPNPLRPKSSLALDLSLVSQYKGMPPTGPATTPVSAAQAGVGLGAAYTFSEAAKRYDQSEQALLFAEMDSREAMNKLRGRISELEKVPSLLSDETKKEARKMGEAIGQAKQDWARQQEEKRVREETRIREEKRRAQEAAEAQARENAMAQAAASEHQQILSTIVGRWKYSRDGQWAIWQLNADGSGEFFCNYAPRSNLRWSNDGYHLFVNIFDNGHLTYRLDGFISAGVYQYTETRTFEPNIYHFVARKE
jgi:hypothetical protein